MLIKLLFCNYQVRLDKVLQDDAPFDICSCQVSSIFYINVYNIYNFEYLVQNIFAFFSFSPIKCFEFVTLLVYIYDSDIFYLNLAVCIALFMVNRGPCKTSLGKYISITSTWWHFHRNNTRFKCYHQKIKTRYLIFAYVCKFDMNIFQYCCNQTNNTFCNAQQKN